MCHWIENVCALKVVVKMQKAVSLQLSCICAHNNTFEKTIFSLWTFSMCTYNQVFSFRNKLNNRECVNYCIVLGVHFVDPSLFPENNYTVNFHLRKKYSNEQFKWETWDKITIYWLDSKVHNAVCVTWLFLIWKGWPCCSVKYTRKNLINYLRRKKKGGSLNKTRFWLNNVSIKSKYIVKQKHFLWNVTSTPQQTNFNPCLIEHDKKCFFLSLPKKYDVHTYVFDWNKYNV